MSGKGLYRVTFIQLITRRLYKNIHFYSVACNKGIFLSHFLVEYTLMLLPVEYLSTMSQTITTALGYTQ